MGLVEIPLKGRKYTWSNMQSQPLLERLDWFFTSASWIQTYPNTLAFPLTRPTSGHTPCVIQIQTTMPKSRIFRFENWWMEHEKFLPMVETVWKQSIHYVDAVKRNNAMFKILRKHLKTWARTLSLLKDEIADANCIISLLDALDDKRSLLTHEADLRTAVKAHLTTLLKQQRIYWQQRGKIKWATVGGENSEFFHSVATIQQRNNCIASLTKPYGEILSEHEDKAQHLLEAFKERLGESASTSIPAHLLELLPVHNNLAFLEETFF